jgi:hypothetical protein
LRWGGIDIDGLSLCEKGKKNDTPRGRSEPEKTHKSESLSDPIHDDWVYYLATKVRKEHGLGWQKKEHLWEQIAVAYWILVGKCSISEMKESWTYTVRPP